MNISFQKELVELLFTPSRLVEINLKTPTSHLSYIKAYAYLEYQEGFLFGILNHEKRKPKLDETVEFFVDSIKKNQIENILDYYENSKKDKTKYSITIFFILLHKANKILNRYELES